MSDREALKRSIDDLSPMGVRFVARMVDSLADPPRVQLPESEPTWITAEPDWIEYFGLMISAHHGITVEALGLTSEEYCDAVDAIVMLRAFRVDRTTMPHRYQLIEIPTAIFESLADAPQSAFEADGPTIDCAYGGNPAAARVSLDRSDAKITVKQIQLSVCDIHAEWEMQA